MKYLKYINYLLRHKWYVMIECFRYGLIWRGLAHDMSKFLPSEFFAYAEKFYGNRLSTEYFDLVAKYGLPEMAPWGVTIEEKFSIAWNYHQKRNKHHWQYWLLREDDGNLFSVGMPEKYLKEMLADWRGAGKAITGVDDTKAWYLKNRKNIILRQKDRKWIESQLGIQDNQ